MSSTSALVDVLENFGGKRILTIGDLMVDNYVTGQVNRISPEAPVPIVDVSSSSFKLGGAGNVVNSIIDMGGVPLPVGVVGDDDYGRWMIRELKSRGIGESCLLTSQDRPTTVKTRIIANRQHLMRIDYEKRDPIDRKLMDRIVSFVEDNVGDVEGAVISDYEKGIVTASLLERVIPALKRTGVCIVADARAGNLLHYSGVTVVRTNTTFSSKATGINLINETSLRNVGLTLLSRLRCEAVVITQGREGMSVFERNGSLTHIPSTEGAARDITGVGDVVTSTLTLATAAGASTVDAARLANYAAGIKVTKFGTATVTKSELKDWLVGDRFGQSQLHE